MSTDDRSKSLLGVAPAQRKEIDREAVEAVRRINDMLDEGWRYEWAADTLTGILETIERTGRVTENQTRAIDNIENARGGGWR